MGADEDATATINYTSGTTARPKGVQLTHRNLWLNAATFGWHMGVSDRDVYLHTLPMFHCNGWGMVYAVTAMGGKHIVLRKVDGAEILRRVDQHGVTLMCGAPAVGSDGARRRQGPWTAPIPGAGTVRRVVAGAPPPTATIEAVERELGWEFIQIYGLTETAPLLTINRGRAEYDDLPPDERARKLGRAGAPALGVTLDTSDTGEVLARSNVVLEGYWDNPEATADGARRRLVPHRRRRRPSTTRATSPSPTARRTSSSPAARTCRRSRSRTACSPTPTWPRSRSSASRTRSGARRSRRSSCWRRAPIDRRGRRSSSTAGRSSPTTSAPPAIEFRDELARTATGKLQKFKLRAPYWEGRDRQVN